MATQQYISALKYHWLNLYDPILDMTMPERKTNAYLIEKADFKPEQRVLDFGCGSLALSFFAKKSQDLPCFMFHPER